MKFLVRLRKERGLNQPQLARVLGVHQSWVNHVESGRYVPSPDSRAGRALVHRTPRPSSTRAGTEDS